MCPAVFLLHIISLKKIMNLKIFSFYIPTDIPGKSDTSRFRIGLTSIQWISHFLNCSPFFEVKLAKCADKNLALLRIHRILQAKKCNCMRPTLACIYVK